MSNRLILGDNLAVLKSLPSNSVDLCYIDPPFFSNRNYEKIWGDENEIRSFKDRWAGGIMHYIEWLKERVDEIWRVLKPSGSLLLHCDYHANAYIRVYILDDIFGRKNFINEIIWQYFMGGKPKKYFANKHDTIYWYAKGSKWTYNELTIKRYLDFIPSLKDESANAESGKDEIGHWSKIKCPDVWSIKGVFNMSKEYIGYPTQKPIALMNRIIKACSNKGDVVLDAFCGGGTTIVCAALNDRQFIGIDISTHAIAVTRARLELGDRAINASEKKSLSKSGKSENLFKPTFSVETPKYNKAMLKAMNPFSFEHFIIEKFGGVSNSKQRNDLGIDGYKDKIPLQVKQSENVGRNVIDNFKSAITRKDKNLKQGIIIAFSFGKGAKEEVSRLRLKENIIIDLVEVSEIIEIATPPEIEITFTYKDIDSDTKLVTFSASGKDIEAWQWDLSYDSSKGFKAGILLESSGVYECELKSGIHNIAARGIDKDGVESIKDMQLCINGGIKIK